MNKQQLANKIWESANKMRSKIEANEYKDYILGFIFYKYLSDQEVKFLKENDFTDEDIEQLSEEDSETVEYIQNNIGYYISYDNLFSTWIKMKKDFDVSNVRDALSAFNRLIHESHKKVFEKIFDTLQTGLSKLGDSSGTQTKAISELLQLIKDIPMDGKQDYDVLGFIYEYLISNFAANAGKKAGEFYTPHEVSLLMSEIVANHLKERETIKIYDPTSGSGSLLINIGKSVAKYVNDDNNIKYYAQELKENTYNLTRMNLVMRGIKPDNIVTRNGDTLEEDWPYFDEKDRINTYEPLYVDAVVSNPPYSQNWDPSNKEHDPRYTRFGLAPKGKADYAFLLHDLFHIKPDGIMTIVLPHGVLFRGGEEGTIRQNLIENNHIDTIIGLPANIFFGTGIPTIIMVLKQRRDNTDVLIIDASKDFVKEGKNNKLRASDIKKIVDTVTKRETINKYSRTVSREEIRANEYNLNIPRYVDSSESPESWDIYATMFGGIPVSEIDELVEYWNAFPNLRDALFTVSDILYVDLATDDIKSIIKDHASIQSFKNGFNLSFQNFKDYLKERLLQNFSGIDISKEETIIADNIFERLQSIPLINKYEAYQLLDNEWNKIAIDLEIIQTEGVEAIKKVDPNMVVKKKDGKEQEIQEGWIGHVLPFDLVQEHILKEETDKLKSHQNRLSEIDSELSELIDSLSEEDKESELLNDSNDAFVAKEVNNRIKTAYSNLDIEEASILNQYLALSKKAEKLQFSATHSEVNWNQMNANKDGTYGKTEINKYIQKLQSEYEFEDGSLEAVLIKVSKLMAEEKELKSMTKSESEALHLLTKKTIESLSDEQVYSLLEKKWIDGFVINLYQLPDSIIDTLVKKLQNLSKKYETTYFEVEQEIKVTESLLASMIDELVGNEFDMKGLSEFKSLLLGDEDE